MVPLIPTNKYILSASNVWIILIPLPLFLPVGLFLNPLCNRQITIGPGQWKDMERHVIYRFSEISFSLFVSILMNSILFSYFNSIWYLWTLTLKVNVPLIYFEMKGFILNNWNRGFEAFKNKFTLSESLPIAYLLLSICFPFTSPRRQYAQLCNCVRNTALCSLQYTMLSTSKVVQFNVTLRCFSRVLSNWVSNEIAWRALHLHKCSIYFEHTYEHHAIIWNTMLDGKQRACAHAHSHHITKSNDKKSSD